MSNTFGWHEALRGVGGLGWGGGRWRLEGEECNEGMGPHAAAQGMMPEGLQFHPGPSLTCPYPHPPPKHPCHLLRPLACAGLSWRMTRHTAATRATGSWKLITTRVRSSTSGGSVCSSEKSNIPATGCDAAARSCQGHEGMPLRIQPVKSAYCVFSLSAVFQVALSGRPVTHLRLSQRESPAVSQLPGRPAVSFEFEFLPDFWVDLGNLY